MSKFTLDDAIKHCLEVAEQNEKKAEYRPRMDYYDEIESRTDCLECATDHRQLAEWLTELKEAKRLLKVAVKDFRKATKDCTRNFINLQCASCPHTYTIHGCVWRYTGKALALAVKDGGNNAKEGETNG